MSNDTTVNFYDATLNDDASPGEVINARRAGREWAEREWSLLDGDDADRAAQEDDWLASDASALVAFGPSDDVDDQTEREAELAAICCDEAEDKWAQICESHRDSSSFRRWEIRCAIAKEVGVTPDSISVWSDWSNPAARDWREASNDALIDLLAELGDVDEERSVIVQAIGFIAAGRRVFVAQDEDGAWFADVASTARKSLAEVLRSSQTDGLDYTKDIKPTWASVTMAELVERMRKDGLIVEGQ
jgi:hypothetical protein